MKLSVIFFAVMLAAGFAAATDGTAINGADVAWVGACAALVMLMTPALGFFYGGLVRQKNLLSVLAQSLAIFAVASLVWALWGFSLAFAPDGGIIGSLKWVGLSGVGLAPFAAYAATIPLLLFFFFQLKFAAITPALIIGAFAERVRFSTLLIFTVLWVTLIYSPIAHWVWGAGGWLHALGALDFAGGTVVHIAAGFSALAAAMVIGKRKDFGKPFHPNNVPFVILGAALLWFGWFGFNGGSALAANGIAVMALVTTNIAAAAAAVSWMLYDWASHGKPSATGIAIGAVCGLVAITPASGYVSPIAAIVIGAVAGLLCNAVANWRASRTALDDSLDVFACHGIGGVWGALATGIFASTAVNPAGANGLLYGNPHLLLVQAIAVVSVAAFTFAGSFLLLKAIALFKPLRVDSDSEEAGLDLATHGENAYR